MDLQTVTPDVGVFAVRRFPDPDAKERYDDLVGLDEVKSRLVKEARLLLDDGALDNWLQRHHRGAPTVKSFVQRRPRLFLFEGDVGSGKTALAESFGDAVARDGRLDVTLYSLGLAARGNGVVGQMTTLISGAFAEVERDADAARRSKSRRRAFILLIDEADALAQSREAVQMHHEDRAGVNAVIRGINALSAPGLPTLTVMCTNRVDAIDPAIRRRAAATFTFTRPTDIQRRAVLRGPLAELGLSAADIEAIVRATGPAGRPYGYTYSDLTDRLIPSIILDAFPDQAVTAARAFVLAQQLAPTPPFKGEP